MAPGTMTDLSALRIGSSVTAADGRVKKVVQDWSGFCRHNEALHYKCHGTWETPSSIVICGCPGHAKDRGEPMNQTPSPTPSPTPTPKKLVKKSHSTPHPSPTPKKMIAKKMPLAPSRDQE